METLDHLVDLLQEELKLYGQLLALVEEERDLLAVGRIREVEEMVAGLNHVTDKIKALEDQRGRLVASLARTYQLDQETLSELLQVVDYNYRQRLEKLGDELRHVVEATETANKYNAYLIRESLDFIRQTFVDTAREMGEISTYGKRGDVDKPRLASAMVDRRG